MTAQEALAWEAEHRQRAGVAALVASACTFLGVVFTTVGQPGSTKFDDRILTVVDTMNRTATGQPNPPGRVSAYTVDVGQHPALPIAGAVLYGVGSLAIFFVMAYLFRATRARRPELPQLGLVLAAVGAVGFGVGRAIAEVSRYVGAIGFVDATDKSNSAASDALSPTATLVGQVVWEFCALSLGAAFVIITLNAMRVGLLTRFMGVLGIIVGVTIAPVLPLDQQQQLREQRQAARAGSEPRTPAEEPRAERKPPAAPPPAPPRPRRPDPPAPGEPHSSSKKKKRKRR